MPRWLNYTLFAFLINPVFAKRQSWAILVSTSRFWSNYRDSVNLYYFYNTVKELGIPDSRIIVYLGEDIPCNARNPFPGRIYANPPSQSAPVYPIDHPRVDVRGNEVNRKNFLNLLSGRYHGYQPRSQRISSALTGDSNVFVYFSGHSAVGFTKFQDFEDVAAADIADAFATMRVKKMYNELFWLADTCRAASLHNEFYSNGILALGSSGPNEKDKAYSHGVVSEIGQSLLDRFTYMTQNVVRRTNWRQLTMGDYFASLNPELLGAVPHLKEDLLGRDSKSVKLIDFMGSPALIGRRTLTVDLSGYDEKSRKDSNEPATKYTPKEFSNIGQSTYLSLYDSMQSLFSSTHQFSFVYSSLAETAPAVVGLAHHFSIALSYAICTVFWIAIFRQLVLTTTSA